MRRRERSGPSGRDYSCVGPTRYGPAGVFYGPPVASSARELFMLGGSWGYGPAVIFYGPSRLPAPTSLMRREAQERVRRLGEIWTGPATEVTFAWAHMIGSMRARRSRERPRNEGGPQLMGDGGKGLGTLFPTTKTLTHAQVTKKIS